jgi:phosphoribosylglycinamide formyltransferase-1
LTRSAKDVEHRLYPEALRLFAEERVQVDERTVRLADYDRTNLF